MPEFDKVLGNITRYLSFLKTILYTHTYTHTHTTKVHLVKAIVFPVVMRGCESWTMKKAEC